MKTARLSKKSAKISRETVSHLGKTLYSCPEVDSVLIKINFKDGSNIGFRRSELGDEVGDLFGGKE